MNPGDRVNVAGQPGTLVCRTATWWTWRVRLDDGRVISRGEGGIERKNE